MRFSQVTIVLAALSTAASAAPIDNTVEKRWFPGTWWASSGNSNTIADFIKRHPWPGVVPSLPRLQQIAGQCDLSQAQLPQAPTPLPPVSAGLSLYHVALGRGTQNYTCSTGNSSAAPVAVGAVAVLFNASCIAANNKLMLNTLPVTVLNMPAPSSSASNSNPVYGDMSGHHYFTDNTTPYFNLDTDQSQWGQGGFKKLAATPAPADAPNGPLAQPGNGAVAWLKLASKNPDSCAFTEVYRVNTAGGNPPATCAGMPTAFEVQYSAEYWFFS